VRKLRFLAACECSGRVRDAFAARGWESWSCDLLPSTEVLAEVTVFPSGKQALWPREGARGAHYQGDVLDLFGWDHPVNHERAMLATNRALGARDWSVPLWDLVIAFPPCTDLTLGGARWFKYKDITRGGNGDMQRGAAFFMDMVYASRGNEPSCAQRIAVENPLGKMSRWYRWPDQVVEPWWFGDPYAKRTGLWLRNLPRLVADKPVAPVGRVATGGGSWRTDKTAERVAMSRYEDSRGRENRAYMRSLTFEGTARAMAEQWGAYVEREEDFNQWRKERDEGIGGFLPAVQEEGDRPGK
jgi:hypothetical protein